MLSVCVEYVCCVCVLLVCVLCVCVSVCNTRVHTQISIQLPIVSIYICNSIRRG